MRNGNAVDRTMNIESLADELILDTAKSLDRLDGEVEFLREIYGLFLEDGPARLATIGQALDEDDFAKATKAAHSLKGMCGTLNAVALMELAQELEMACREQNKAEAMRLKGEVAHLMDVVVERIAAFMA